MTHPPFVGAFACAQGAAAGDAFVRALVASWRKSQIAAAPEGTKVTEGIEGWAAEDRLYASATALEEVEKGLSVALLAQSSCCLT